VHTQNHHLHRKILTFRVDVGENFYLMTRATSLVLSSTLLVALFLRRENYSSALIMGDSLRRSKRIRELLRRSSSLGEESGSDHFDDDNTNNAKRSCHRELSTQRLFSVGLMADIQYAPIPDGYSYSGIPRYYRHALDAARHASRHFESEKVDLAINLG
jgi:hypothetical protein